MSNFDNFKLAVEALSGGKNTVLFDDIGMPSIVVPFAKQKISDLITGAPQDTHPAFIIDGDEIDLFYVSKFDNIVMNDRAYSLPFQDPRASLNFDQALQFCANKGTGWHLLTQAESAAISLWCHKNGFLPRGNNNYGSDITAAHEKGVKTHMHSATQVGRVATGSGPASWFHDGTNEGISGLNGNVWNWVSGFRLMNGEIQVIPYNNAAKNVNHGADSTLWKAILPDGTLVEPGTAGTLKYDAESATPSGIRINTVVANQTTDANSVSKTFHTVGAAGGVTIPMLLRALGLAPVDGQQVAGTLYVRNNGERLPLRFGSFTTTSGAGVSALDLSLVRSHSATNVGLRGAFVNL